jgi:hypothetical protein
VTRACAVRVRRSNSLEQPDIPTALITRPNATITGNPKVNLVINALLKTQPRYRSKNKNPRRLMHLGTLSDLMVEVP